MEERIGAGQGGVGLTVPCNGAPPVAGRNLSSPIAGPWTLLGERTSPSPKKTQAVAMATIGSDCSHFGTSGCQAA